MHATGTETLCAVRDAVAEQIGASQYRSWFGSSTNIELDEHRVAVVAPNDFVARWISSNYQPQLAAAARTIIGPHAEVSVRVAEAAPAAASNSAAAPAATPTLHRASPLRSLQRDSRTLLKHDLGSFVVGPANELAYSVVSAFCRAPGAAFKHLVVHGGCGLGKTHLLQGVCNAISRAHPTLAWRYTSGEEFTNEFISAVRNNRLDAFRARFRGVDLLVIDDVHFVADKKGTQDELLHTYDAIDSLGKMVVVSSDCHPRAIGQFSERLVDRLIAAMIVEVSPPDLDTRREILRRRAAHLACPIPAETIDFIASRVTRNVRELEGALLKISAYAALVHEPVSVDLARRALENYIPSARAPDAPAIEQHSAAYFDTSVEALHSASRDRTVTTARAAAMFLIRKFTTMSFPEIGRHMGSKQHSTVVMAVRRVQDILDRDGTFAWKSARGPREERAAAALDAIQQRLRSAHEPHRSASAAG